MKKISVFGLAASVSLSLLTTIASAAITYVDATEGAGGNTTLINGSQFNSTAAAGDDGLWRGRAFGNGATIFEADAFDGSNEDAHMLVTSISGLTPGASYNVYGYFWRDPSNWRLKATVNIGDITNLATPDPLDDFLSDDPSVYFSAAGPNPPTTISNPAVAGDFDVAPILAEGNRNLLQANLGSIAADGNGVILVGIDDGDNGLSNGRRTWYDGVGYEPVPEPTSIALIGLSGIAMLLGRRR